MPARAAAAVLLAAALMAVGCGGEQQAAPGPPEVTGGEFVAPKTGRRAEVWALGDSAAPTGRARAVAKLIGRSRPELLLYLGDVYELGTAADFRRNYTPLYGSLHRRTAATPGNHEWPLAGVGYLPYWRRALGRPLPSYYSFEAGGWQILGLNSEGAHGPGSEQARWLSGRLRGGGDCRLAFWHRPRFSAGPHGDQADMDPIWRIARGRVRLILNGHDHNLQQLPRRAGVTTLIVGAGGATGYPFSPRHRRLVFGDDRHGGALRLVLTPGRARYAFVSTGGRVLHRGSARCRRG